MALKDLDGKRTGRPPGAKTASRVRRDILWAYNHLDKPDAKPPSPGALMWPECARKDPGLFLPCAATWAIRVPLESLQFPRALPWSGVGDTLKMRPVQKGRKMSIPPRGCLGEQAICMVPAP